jgi:hypothetical protein
VSQPVLLFVAGGLKLGVGLADVARLLVENGVVRVPFAHPAMAGLLDAGPEGPVPIFDLFGLVDPSRVRTHVPGATVALFPTEKGPVGLRLEALAGSAAAYSAVDAEEQRLIVEDTPAQIRPTLAGAARADADEFSFFSPDAFLAVIGL